MNALDPRDRPSLRLQPARDGPDFWPTPPCLIATLVQCVLPEAHAPIWEPATGDGRLADALRTAGHVVHASDLYPRADSVECRDFLHEAPPSHGCIAATNPPFNALDAFIARGLSLLDTCAITGLVLLVRHDALTAAGRAPAFGQAAALWTCAWRPRWIDGSTGTGRWSNAWVSWQAGTFGPPLHRWVTPAELRQARLQFPACLEALAARGARVGLDGQPTGEISEAERQHAASRLAAQDAAPAAARR